MTTERISNVMTLFVRGGVYQIETTFPEVDWVGDREQAWAVAAGRVALTSMRGTTRTYHVTEREALEVGFATVMAAVGIGDEEA
jgi:hypothetical protein